MADNWQVGDLALCVKLGPWRHLGLETITDGHGVRPGQIHTVRRIGAYDGILCLWLDAVKENSWGASFVARNFRRIPPLTDEERDEFLANIKTPARVDALLQSVNHETDKLPDLDSLPACGALSSSVEHGEGDTP